MGKRPFQRILLRNLVLITLPLSFFLLALALLAGVLLGHPGWRVISADGAEQAVNLYQQGEKNVSLSCGGLVPSGMVYEADGKEKGVYFYELKNRTVYLYLLPDSLYEHTAAEDYRLPESIHVTFREDASAASLLESDYAENLGVPASATEGLVSPVVFDALHYPGREIGLLRFLKTTAQIAGSALFVYLILVIIFPGLNILNLRYRRMGYALDSLDRELRDDLDFYNGRAAVTGSLILRISFPKIWIMRRDELREVTTKSRKKNSGRVYFCGFSDGNGHSLSLPLRNKEEQSLLMELVAGPEGEEESE